MARLTDQGVLQARAKKRRQVARVPGVVLLCLGVVAAGWSTLPWWHIAALFVLGTMFAFPRH